MHCAGNPCSDTAVETLQDLETLMRRNRVIKKLPKTPPRVPSSSGGGGSSTGGAPGQPGKHGTKACQQWAVDWTVMRQVLKFDVWCVRVGVPLSGAAFEIERRLQHLEEAEATIRSELEHVRRSVRNGPPASQSRQGTALRYGWPLTHY